MDMKTYTFKVVVEPDEDRWHSYCPALHNFGASTWGETREEAFQHIQEVVAMIVAELREDGIVIPTGPKGDVDVFEDERVAITV
jgi:predicted RNase H-like HicB family nuclease